MPVCKNCGRPYDSEQSFCAGCGRPILHPPSEEPHGDSVRIEDAAPTPGELTSQASASPEPIFADGGAVAGREGEDTPKAGGTASFTKKLTATQIAVFGALVGLLLGGIYLAYTSWRIAEQRKTAAALARALQENVFVPSSPVAKAPVPNKHAKPAPVSASPAAPRFVVNSASRTTRSVAKKSGDGSWQVTSGEPQAKAVTTQSVPPPPPAPAVPAKTPIRVLREVPPKFPMAAKLTLSTGDVHVHVSVSAAGAVQEATAISGPRMLRKAACDNVRQWSFQPATLNGKPVAGETEVVVSFSLEGDE